MITRKSHHMFPRWKKFVAALFASSLLVAVAPTQSASAKAINDARKKAIESSKVTPAPNAPTTPAEQAGAEVIAAVVPFLPMETSGTAFARLYALNLGASPTAENSTTTISIPNLPEGVTITGASPAPSASAPGWKCTTTSCSWVNAKGEGAPIPLGKTVDGIVSFNISASAVIATLSDTQVADVIDASSKVESEKDANRQKLQAILKGLTQLSVDVKVEGDAKARTQKTTSYLGVTQSSGRARVAAILIGNPSASAGDKVSWTAHLLNIGGAASSQQLSVKSVLPKSLGLENVTATGTNWECKNSDTSLENCDYNQVLTPGKISEPLRISASVKEDAEVDKENSWQISVDGMPPYVPGDAQFTVTKATAPDLSIKMQVPNQVVTPGSTMDINIQLGSIGGSARKRIELNISGIPGATVKELAMPEKYRGVLLQSTDSSGNPISTPALKSCDVDGDFIVCEVNRLNKGELLASRLVVQLPRNLDTSKDTLAVQGTVATEDEEESTLTNNSAGVSVVVQPGNKPFPTLMAAKKSDNGAWEAFSGESINLKYGKSSEFGYVVSNSGAAPFTKGSKLSFLLSLQDGVTVTPSGDWKCEKTEIVAPEFTEDQRLGAATAARTAGFGVDLDAPASKLEASLMKQIQEQATVTAIPQVEGNVPALSCSLTLKKAIGVNEKSPVAIFTASVDEDAEYGVALWRADMVSPKTPKPVRLDVSAITATVRKAVAPIVVTQPVRAGSYTTLRVSILNKGESVVEHPSVVLSIPPGLRLNQDKGIPKGWSCVLLAQGISGGLAACAGPKIDLSRESPFVEFVLQADVLRAKPSDVSAIALANSKKIGLSSTTKNTVGVKEPLAVKIVGPNIVNDISVPLGGGEPAATRVILSAQSPNEGITYSWSQVCATEGEKGCSSVSPKVKWLKKSGQSGEFTAPSVTSPIDITIKATASENNAVATDVFTVRVTPRPKVQAPPKASGSSIVGTFTQQSRLDISAVKWTSNTPSADEEDNSDSEDENLFETVTPAIPSALVADQSKGSGVAPARMISVRQLNDLAVRANALGGNNISLSNDRKISALASASVSGATWAWTVVDAPSALSSNAEFTAAIAASTKASLSVTIPAGVDASGVLVLKVTATSADKTASDFLIVRLSDESAEPEQKIAVDGVNFQQPVVLNQQGGVSLKVAVDEGNTVSWSSDNDLVAVSNGSATEVTVTASSTRGRGTVIAVVRNADGVLVDVLLIPVVIATGSAFPNFCDQLETGVKEATASLAGFNIDAELGAAPDCEFEDSISFEDKTLSLGLATLTNVSGTISRDGIFISQGTATTQVQLPVSEMSVKNLLIPFRPGNSIGNINGYLNATLADSVLKAMRIEGWGISATVRILNGDLSKVIISASENAPANADSASNTGETTVPDTAAPETSSPDTTVASAEGGSDEEPTSGSVSASGTFANDGSVLLTAEFKNLPIYDAVKVNASGDIFIQSDKNIEFSLEAELADAVQITDGVSLEEANLTLTHEDLSGNGTVNISRNGLDFDVEATIELSDEEQKFTFDVKLAELTPVEGFTLKGVDVSGELSHTEKGFDGSITAQADDITFGGGIVKVTEPTIALGLDCSPDDNNEEATTTVAGDETKPEVTTDENGCEVLFSLKTGIEIGAENPVKGTLEGSIDTAKKTVSFESTFENIRFTDDVELTEVNIKVEYEDGEVSFSGRGEMDIFDTTVSANIIASKENMVMRAAISNLAPFGDEELRLTAGEVIVVAGYEDDKKYEWTPKNDELKEAVGEQELTEGDIRVAAIVGLPDAINDAKTLLGDKFTLPTKVLLKGEYSFSSGQAAFDVATIGGTLSASGSFSRESSDADWLWAVSLKTEDSLKLIPGLDELTLTNFSINVTNKDKDGKAASISVNLDGGLKLDLAAGTTIEVAAKVRFSGTDNWELEVTGAIAGSDGGTWEIIPGLRLPAAQMKGSVSKIEGAFAVDLRLEQSSAWRPVSSVTINDMFVEIGVKKDAKSEYDFTFELGGKVKIAVGSLVVPEIALTGGFKDKTWFLQVQVGDQKCRDVVVADTTQSNSGGASATSTTVRPAATTTTVRPAATTTTVRPVATTTTVRPGVPGVPPRPVATTTTVRPVVPGVPPRPVATTTTVRPAATTTTVRPATTTTTVPPTTTTTVGPDIKSSVKNVCERVITVTNGLELIDSTFRLEYNTTSKELSVGLNGGIRILGFQIDTQVKLSNKGLLLVAGVKNWELFAGGPTFAEMSVIFSTYESSYTLSTGYKTTVAAMDVTLVAQMAMPEGIKKTVGDVQLEPLKISLRGLLTGNIDLNIGIILPPEAWIFKAGGYGVRLASVGLQLSIRNFADLTVGIYGEARLLVPNQTDQVPGRIAISFSSTGTLSINMSIGLDKEGKSVPWLNVFGVEGLTVNFAAFSFGINFSSTPIPTPEIGMAVSFQLPKALRNLVGMEDGINIEGAFFFSTTRGVCLVVTVGQEPKVGDNARTLPKAINLFSGNLIGNYMGINFAPIGCKIAEKTYDPGISVGFSAAIMGVSFTALAKVDIKKLEMQVYANFDAFTIGGLRMKQTYLDLFVSGSSPLDSRLLFSGGFDLDMPSGTTTVSLQVKAQLGSEIVFAIDGRIDNLVVVPGIAEIKQARLQGLVKPTELRVFINVSGNVVLLGSTISGQFRLDVDSSGVREVSANLNGDIKVVGDDVRVNGSFAFQYLKGGFPKLNFNGALFAGSTQLASATGSLDQYAFSVKATINVSDVFNGQVEGKIVLCNPDGSIKVKNKAGQWVTGATGDFYFEASAVVNVGIASANGTVRLGRTPDEDRVISQNCPVMAPVVTSANADQVMTNGVGNVIPTTTTVRAAGVTTTVPVTTTTVRPTTTTSTTTTTVPRPQQPLAPRTFWSGVAVTAVLNYGPLQANARVAGTFDTAGNVNLAIDGRANVAPIADAALSGTVVRQNNVLTANISIFGNVAGFADVRFNGSLINGVYELTGEANLNFNPAMKGYGWFLLTNKPGQEGLRAGGFFQAGSGPARAEGWGNVVFSSNWWGGDIGVWLFTPIGNVWSTLSIGNLRFRPAPVRWGPWVIQNSPSCQSFGGTGGIRVVAGQEYCELPQVRLTLISSVTVFGQNFGINADIAGNSFRLVASAPGWYNDGVAARNNWEAEQVMNFLGTWRIFWFFGWVYLQTWWGGQLIIQSGNPNEPSIAFAGRAKARITYHRWMPEFALGIRGSFNPISISTCVKAGDLPEFCFNIA